MYKEASFREKVEQLVRTAGGFIRQERENFDCEKIELKGKSDLVSYVDRAAEEMLIEGCRDLIPGSGFMTEEAGLQELDKEWVWIIDPLDGTTNFIHGLPAYSVSLALCCEGESVLGFVYEISRDELFVAWKDGGAWMNGKQIQVSSPEKLEDSLLVTGFPYKDNGRMDDYLAVFKALMARSHGVRRIGSAAVDLAWVACGRMEAFYEYNLNAWDVAAGYLLVEEAGGKVTDFKNGREFLFGRQIAASNAKIHAEMLEVIHQYFQPLPEIQTF